ncbi:hypothetical protein RM533_06380 [Croceicoccus sp. F390]|uniref:Uncharacterized protein n=1 Tax=Croceicoccus esteveae TaxID=3075597 RepID=A0ABU2ZHN5_9SPHN|nr:hypothetical protein [Croceicoccus sp. F390]MDT0575809.1 hypothetical protein [Croceicoccus sp. F390]
MNVTNRLLAATAATAMAVAAPAAAQMQRMDPATAWSQYSEARKNMASAGNVMSGDVTNGFNMLGNIRDLILTPNGSQVEYVLYEVPFPWSTYGANDRGFVAWDNVAIEGSFGGDLNIRIDDDADAQSPDRLTLTAAQAERRLASNIIGSMLTFSDGQQREIEDILFDRNSGAITSYVVQFDNQSVFGSDTRRIPASAVTMQADGRMMLRTPSNTDYLIWIP